MQNVAPLHKPRQQQQPQKYQDEQKQFNHYHDQQQQHQHMPPAYRSPAPSGPASQGGIPGSERRRSKSPLPTGRVAGVPHVRPLEVSRPPKPNGPRHRRIRSEDFSFSTFSPSSPLSGASGSPVKSPVGTSSRNSQELQHNSGSRLRQSSPLQGSQEWAGATGQEQYGSGPGAGRATSAQTQQAQGRASHGGASSGSPGDWADVDYGAAIVEGDSQGTSAQGGTGVSHMSAEVEHTEGSVDQRSTTKSTAGGKGATESDGHGSSGGWGGLWSRRQKQTNSDLQPLNTAASKSPTPLSIPQSGAKTPPAGGATSPILSWFGAGTAITPTGSAAGSENSHDSSHPVSPHQAVPAQSPKTNWFDKGSGLGAAKTNSLQTSPQLSPVTPPSSSGGMLSWFGGAGHGGSSATHTTTSSGGASPQPTASNSTAGGGGGGGGGLASWFGGGVAGGGSPSSGPPAKGKGHRRSSSVPVVPNVVPDPRAGPGASPLGPSAAGGGGGANSQLLSGPRGSMSRLGGGVGGGGGGGGGGGYGAKGGMVMSTGGVVSLKGGLKVNLPSTSPYGSPYASPRNPPGAGGFASPYTQGGGGGSRKSMTPGGSLCASPRTVAAQSDRDQAKLAEIQKDGDYEVEEETPEVLGPSNSNVLGKPYQDLEDKYKMSPKELGRGNFGVIHVCENLETGERYACKTITKAKLECWDDVDDVKREVQVLETLRGHPHVVSIIETIEDEKEVHIIMELCEGGELFDRILERKYYGERQAAKVIRSVVEVLDYCHQRGIVHRDLKPENILLVSKRSDTRCQVIDFGMAYCLKPGERCKLRAGTPNYIAPEVIAKNYGAEADVWSAGVILYVLLCGLPPFWGDTTEDVFKSILWQELDFETEPWPVVSTAAKDLVRRMLTRKFDRRITVSEILKHPWIKALT
ncbi:unnamed protein product [Closterium sp. NIES-53]